MAKILSARHPDAAPSEKKPKCGPYKCSICGDLEPFHVHDGNKRIDDYFTVGRGMSDIVAARVWKMRALDAEGKIKRRSSPSKKTRKSQ